MDGVEVEGVTYNRVDPPVYLRDPHHTLHETLAEEAAITEATPPRDHEFVGSVESLFLQAEELLLQKHDNYGPKNISRSPGGPINGLRVRLHDKFARIDHMLTTGTPDQVGEPLEETFMDAMNYCAIAVLVLRGEWPDA